MITYVPGYNVTTDNIRSKTIKNSFIKWKAGLLVDALSTTNSILTVDNSHDAFLIKNYNSNVLNVVILRDVNDFLDSSEHSLRRIYIAVDSIGLDEDREIVFSIPDLFHILGNSSLTKTVYGDCLQIFVIDIVDNIINIHNLLDINNFFELDGNGDIMPSL